MNNLPSNEDLRVFTVVARLSSFIAAAEELQVSTGYVSKRIRVLETALGMRLLHRTTRTVTVTQEGERIFHWAQRVLDDVEQLLQETAITRAVPSGTLRISSSFGFGRRVVAPLLSQMAVR